MITNRRGKSVLSLVEMTIAMGVLAICGVLTVMLFLHAHFAGLVSSDINMAMLAVQSQAEILRLEEPETMEYFITFDEDWKEVEENPLFIMKVELEKESGWGGDLFAATITVERTRKYPFMKEERKNLADVDIRYFIQKGGAGL